MSFTAQLFDRYHVLFEQFWSHPFLRGLHAGDAPAESVLHYVVQDGPYLDAFIRCYGAGISRAPDREWAAWFARQVQFIATDERTPHRVLCAAIGADYDGLARGRLAPTAQAYVDHLERCAHVGLGVLLAAQLPCVWTYTWAGDRALTTDPIEEGNPFAPWWQFYGSADCQEIYREFRDRTDQLARNAGSVEQALMAEAFERSCQYEVRFWEMAWTRETWADPTTTSAAVGRA